jgi:hypothetical protein
VFPYTNQLLKFFKIVMVKGFQSHNYPLEVQADLDVGCWPRGFWLAWGTKSDEAKCMGDLSGLFVRLAVSHPRRAQQQPLSSANTCGYVALATQTSKETFGHERPHPLVGRSSSP